MQRYELGIKFWEVGVDGATLTTRWGRGDDAQVKAQQFANPAAAQAAQAKLVAEKIAKGFRKVKAARRTPPVAAPSEVAASGTVAADELVITELRTGGGRTGRIVIAGKRVLVAGEQVLVSSNGTRFHRRKSPGEVFCLYPFGDAIYALGNDLSVTRDNGASWRKLELADDPWYKFVIFRDSSGTFWIGADDGKLFTSDSLEGKWKKSKLEGSGKILDIIEVDGRLLIVGHGSYLSGGAKLEPVRGIDPEHIICRAVAAPSGTLIAIGDKGVAYRSTDRGAGWTAVSSGVTEDLEDFAWVAGALFVVGAEGTLLRSDDDGASWIKIESGTEHHLWGITSWGDGALIGGEAGVLLSLAAPADPYWRGTTDTFAPPPPTIDPAFTPRRAAAAAVREQQYAELLAQARAAHDQISVKSGLSRPRDANPRLAKLVEESPDDDPMSAQVYADWLQGEGDPRGELAAIQLQRASIGKSKDLKKAEKALLATHADRFLGKLAPHELHLKLRWRAGFLYSARVANNGEDDDDARDKAKVTVPDLVSWLLDEPSARFLRKLTVGIVTSFENDYGDVAARIGQRYLPALRELFLGDFDIDETELSWSALGDLSPIYPSLPNLRSLRIRSGSMELGKIVLPALESFTVETGGLDRDNARSIAYARWPGLRRLSIQIGSPNYDGDAQVSDLRPILDGVGLPRLAHLGLKNCELTDELIEPLATSRILPQLQSLDLAMSTMSDEGAKLMFRYQKAFAHLEQIDLDDNFISSEGKRLLEATKLPIELGEQRDDEGDPDMRFASAAE